MNAVIYARYSSENQNDQSIEQQVRECKDFADGNGITIIDTYSDRAMTGRNDNRAAFQKMIRDSVRRQFEAVIVWKIDRFGRNREEIALNKSKLRHNGVKILYAKEHIPETPEGIILESVLEGIAEYYSASLSQNIMRGMRENALNCLSTGPGLSLGYYLKDKRFYVDEHGAGIVKTIFNDYANGAGITEIYNSLNEKGYKTIHGKPFNCNAIIRILGNRRYIGEYKWHDVFNPNGMPRIIDNDLWERVQNRRKKTKKAPVQSRGVDYLLTSKLFCGLCGKPMIG
ncbi:MAG: recombinase family protein, partial [Clostridiales bacterium]|nr:recombinase family protein [Clostridiales bacterium]